MSTKSSGFFIQGTFGGQGNFEAVVPGRTSGLAHIWRNNDLPALPWSAPDFFATGTFGGASLIQSSLGGGMALEAAARSGNQVVFFIRAETPPYGWSAPAVIATVVSGTPALIQGAFGANGNYEMVVPMAAGGIGHFWRDNDAGPGVWHGPEVFGAALPNILGVALIQSTYGNLEVVATAGSGTSYSIHHFWRDEAGWHGPSQIFLPNAFGAVSPMHTPGFIQSADGNFQVVFPDGSDLVHMMRDNSDPGLTWNPVARFGGYVSTGFTAASLIQSNYGPPGAGNFEVLARKTDKGPGLVHVVHFWRTTDPSDS